ncbi:MAG: septal ring lytic transglycosylase RlpA family protein [Actinobacteria bacterium]|nr:septal ring lytic transglycosylase RlpA family protein [Actinomycetota bacterium]
MKKCIALILMAAGTLPAVNTSAQPPVALYPPSETRVREAKKAVDTLAEEVEELQLSINSLNVKIDIASNRIVRLGERYARAKAEFDERNRVFGDRLVAIYKNRHLDGVTYILNSDSLGDLLGRMKYLADISMADKRLIEELSRRRLDAETAKDEAQEEKAGLLEMRRELNRESKELSARLDWAKVRFNGLTALVQKAREEASRRMAEERIAISIPVGTKPILHSITVHPYADRKFTATTKMPGAFKATGQTLTGVASWYGNEFNGRHSANGEIFNEEDFTAASKELPFGTYLAVTYKEKRIVVRINDRGPYIKGRFLDLSKGAARALALGLGEVTAEIVIPADTN